MQVDPSILTALGGNQSKYVAPGGSDTVVVVKDSPGRLCVVSIMQVSGSGGGVIIYDNASAASGDILFKSNATPAIYQLGIVANNGITVHIDGGGAVGRPGRLHLRNADVARLCQWQ